MRPKYTESQGGVDEPLSLGPKENRGLQEARTDEGFNIIKIVDGCGQLIFHINNDIIIFWCKSRTCEICDIDSLLRKQAELMLRNWKDVLKNSNYTKQIAEVKNFYLSL